jgi:malonyl-CoA O-methyltransferase
VSALAARDGYRRWASHYDAETAVSFLENELVSAFGVSVAGRRLLDVGCGTGRRLHHTNAAFAVGVDLTPDMLAHADGELASELAAADIRALPFATSMFDTVWCRLVIGHVRELDAAYEELARVCAVGGTVIVTDFHADAVAAGHRRTFRDADGVVHEIEHYVHTLEQHTAAAQRSGLTRMTHTEGIVGPEIRTFYEQADRMSAYDAQRGLAIVLALHFQKIR